MIARILVKPAATKTQILMLFALVFTMASVAVALPVPQAAYRWIGALLGVVVILFFGGYVVRHTMIIYEYLLYADRLIVRRHFRKWIRTTATISHKSIQKILPITDPELQPRSSAVPSRTTRPISTAVRFTSTVILPTV